MVLPLLAVLELFPGVQYPSIVLKTIETLPSGIPENVALVPLPVLVFPVESVTVKVALSLLVDTEMVAVEVLPVSSASESLAPPSPPEHA